MSFHWREKTEDELRNEKLEAELRPKIAKMPIGRIVQRADTLGELLPKLEIEERLLHEEFWHREAEAERKLRSRT